MAGRQRAVGHPSVTPPPYVSPDITHPEVTERTSRRRTELMLPGVDDGPRAVCYGEQSLGGKLQFVHHDAAHDQAWLVIELCAGECDGLNEVKFADGRTPPPPGPAGFWEYWWYAGTAAGAVDTHLQAVRPSWNEAFAGTSYVMVLLRSFGRYWKSELQQFQWRMRTRKCLMADTGLFVYSTSVWDQWYDYARWSEGKQLPASRVDAASFVAAKAADVAAGRKHDCHMALMEWQKPDDVIDTFRLIARAYWFWNANKVKVVADRPGASVATIDDDAIPADAKVDLDRIYDIVDRPNVVTLWYTDTTNGWQLKPYSYPETDPVGEEVVEEEHRIPHLHDPAQIKTLALYLYKKRIYDARLKETWMGWTGDRQLGDIVTRFIESRGTTVQLRLVKRTKDPSNKFVVELHEHNDAMFVEFSNVETTKLQSTIPDPAAAPPNIDLATFSFVEDAPYKTQDNTFLPRAALTFAMPTNFSYFAEDVSIDVSVNGGPTRAWFPAKAGTTMTPVLWETGIYTLTLKTRNRITEELSSGLVVAVNVTGVSGTPPEVVDVVHDAVARTLYFGFPQIRSTTLYGAPFWSNGSGIVGLVAASVNDSLLTATCFTTPSGVSWLRHDAGVAGKRFRQAEVYTVGAPGGSIVVKYSTDNSTWTSTTAQPSTPSVDIGGGIFKTTISWVDPGANKRYWRIEFSAVATGREVHLAEYLGTASGIDRFQILDLEGGTPRAFGAPIPAASIPTLSKPLDISGMVYEQEATWDHGGFRRSTIKILTLSTASVTSAGVSDIYLETALAVGGAAPYWPQTIQSAVPLSAGNNDSVVLPASGGIARFTGSVHAVVRSIVSPSSSCAVLAANATGNALGFLHEYTFAPAGEAISVPGGRAVYVQAGELFWLTWDADATKWRIEGQGSPLTLMSDEQLAPRIVLNGQEYFQPANTSPGGIAFLLGVNRSGNRQLWIGDTDYLAQNSANPVIVINPAAGAITALSTDATTQLPLTLRGSTIKFCDNSTTFTGVRRGSVVRGATTLVPGASTTVTVTVTGAVAGDNALAYYSASLGGADMDVNAVTTNSVEVLLRNRETSNVTIAAGILYVDVWKR
jgi:hypothetical protein